ncbi:hypothetical protein Rhopal_001273-T1 [Rhodotorula paludigena]|uniref:Protein phosphatase n=1 Tax=Rhodotorula paludigena TaxID=86838 RepID=A0AAV5GDD6_9BASI|nr:hypothetical protein Rhopal_001273-T1 [Rhodotorula paludigena]
MRVSRSPLHRLRQISRHLSPSPSPRSTSSSSSSRSLSSSSSPRSSAPTRPWIFTTATAFHGKPPYVPPPPPPPPPGTQPAAAAPPKRLAQGLAADHPLLRWRDEIVAGSGVPKEVGAGHDWFFVEGVPEWDGEGEGTKGVVLGVADGVGGWEDSGVDPSHFSQADVVCVMRGAGERTGGKQLKELLQGAYEDVLAEEGIIAGSSTACLLALDAETGMLHAANLGDSNFLVLRPQPATELPPTPPPSPTPEGETPPAPPTPTVSYRVVHEQQPQIHFFNAPRQLAKLPPGVSKQGAFDDQPRDADEVAFQLEDGDVVLVVTDGYSDNIWAEGETTRLLDLVRTKVDAASPRWSSASEVDAALASSIAQTAVNFARVVSYRRDVYTPFAAEARRWRVKGVGRGGKVDDVTVVCAVVRRGKVEEPVE